MRITQEEVRRVATLARIELTPEEEVDLVEHFDKLLTYMEKLSLLDTTKVEPTAHAIAVPSPLREDRVTNSPNTDALLANAPAREGNFFKVPKIIE
jgi:aspartyl-tRNA(Asn)/glutamyl-tRNA(Gln) amidotransferase subunit C